MTAAAVAALHDRRRYAGEARTMAAAERWIDNEFQPSTS